MQTSRESGESKRASGERIADLRTAADQLFASSTLVDLILVLWREPERRFYVNELIRRTGRFPRSVQLGLATLERAGVVRSERHANARFYQADESHPFFPELASLCAKIGDVRSGLRRALEQLTGVRVAFLRPDDPDSSDLDLVVVGDESARAEAESAVTSVASNVGRRIRTEFLSSDEWARQARRERSFVRWLLEEPRRYVIGDDQTLP